MESFPWIALAAIVVLLIVSGFFSGSETAMTAASRARLLRLEQQGLRRAGIVNALRQEQDRLIGAILLGNNLVNILASAIATSVLIGLLGEAGVVYATIAMTLLVLIFGEVLPKSYAIFHPDRMALAVAPILRPIVFILAPITHTVQVIVRFTLGLFGVRIGAEFNLPNLEEELRGTIDLHSLDAEEVVPERAMLHSVLDLQEVEVGEIMTHRKDVVAIDASGGPDSIVDQVLESPYTRLPLWRDAPDNIVGVLHVKALLREVRARRGDVSGLDVVKIATEPWFIPDSTAALDQLHAFRERREHFALVVDEYGSLMGIVTLEDVLEEIVGEIADEHDVAVAGVRLATDGSVVARGAVTIRDLNRQFDWTLPDEEAATIAGLVMYEARSIPEAGQVFHFHGFRFEILRRIRNQITSIRITPPAPLDAEAEE
ncbi:MAG: HlyC/CorC family transporter [Rhodospirillaceae bacterium]|jgi:Mg2+/Co2+ transporter CorB|nr:HlyC/CorC family transporter [Rhodospirillaceae bacterium]MBT6116776.1 HlyC/CorC family transporter [Rhodospirillaceae bacterium]